MNLIKIIENRLWLRERMREFRKVQEQMDQNDMFKDKTLEKNNEKVTDCTTELGVGETTNGPRLVMKR